ncbi:hypothetical protein PT974_08268 [Cladobotryum mycophilum]|uniref:Mediator complex subunit 9 n=1 Tax=Cladobotryum mycophilum TaxID=491253 RepID=A0ABR0SE15_9HYPO
MASTGSISSTPSLSPISTPGLGPQEAVGSSTTPTISANPLPPLSREFPKPEDEVDVKAALQRQPGRWSIKGQIEAAQRRTNQPSSPVDEKERRSRDLEAAKRQLMAFHETINRRQH